MQYNVIIVFRVCTRFDREERKSVDRRIEKSSRRQW